jgi:hypothetical protein
MKHVKLFEQFTREADEMVSEKVYQLTGAKGIARKVLSAFKKRIENIKFEGDAKATLREVNKEWANFFKEGSDIVYTEVKKVVKNLEEEVVFVTASLSGEWRADSRLNRGGRELYIDLGDFTINVGFMDDADAGKYAKKLGGWTNTPLDVPADADVYGTFDESVGYNNAEIRSGGMILMIDSK